MDSVTLGERFKATIFGNKAAKLDLLNPGERISGAESGLFRESCELTACGVKYDLYDPGPSAKCFILVPGLSILGGQEPRLINLARALAEQGIRTAVPKLPAFSEARFSFIDVDAIVDLALELKERYGGRIGIMGFGFGGGLAARAATEKEIRDFIDPLVLVGPYYSLPELWRRLSRRFEKEPAHGDGKEWDSFIWFRMLAAYRIKDQLALSEEQRSELTYLLSNYSQDGLWERKQGFYRLVLAGRDELMSGFFNGSDMEDLSGSGRMELYPARAVIIHDENDVLIPASHSKRIHAELEERNLGNEKIVVSNLNGIEKGRWPFLFTRLSPATEALGEIFQDESKNPASKMTARRRALKLLTIIVCMVLTALPVAWYAVFIGSVPTVTPAEARLALAQGGEDALLVDVRPSAVYGELHLASSVSWPYEYISILDSADQAPEEFRGKKLYMFCDAGLTSAMAAARLNNLGTADAYNIRGGLQEWYGTDAKDCPTGLCTLSTSDNTEEEMPYRHSTTLEQWLISIATFVVKPIYFLVVFGLILRLRRLTMPDLSALKWGLVLFLAGEGFRAANQILPGEDSYLMEHLYHSGMAMGLGLIVFALLEGLDRWVFSYTDQETKCAIETLCDGCFKNQETPCALRRIMIFLSMAGFAVCLIPTFVQFDPASYTSHIMGRLQHFVHPMLFQMYELRFAPFMAMALFAAALVASMNEKAHPMFWTKALFAGGAGYLGFSMFRLFFFTVFREDLVWFQAWEEIMKTICILFVCMVLWTFRKGIFGPGVKENSVGSAGPAGPVQLESTA